MVPRKVEAGIDLVREHNNVVLSTDRGQLFQLLLCVGSAGCGLRVFVGCIRLPRIRYFMLTICGLAWISRVIEHQQLVALKTGTLHGTLERLWPYFPLRLEARLHDDGLVTSEATLGRVCGPAR